jgi:dihydrofolate synthase/folylpolyglutamate synthase
MNAGTAITVLRALGFGEKACEAAVTNAAWPARMQRLRNGPLVDAAQEAQLWLDGGHNPAAGEAIADYLTSLPERPIFMICGMLNTKDTTGYLFAFKDIVEKLFAVSIPGEANTLSSEETAQAAISVGLEAEQAHSTSEALSTIAAQSPHARVLICGSLYLAGAILRENS